MMSPEERQLLQGLFDRMRNSANGQRDQEAEKVIADNVKNQPYAPYLLAQTVIVQDQALQAANERLQQLEQQVQEHQQQAQQPQQSGGFLSGLFGGGQQRPPQPQQPAVWNQGGAQGYPQQGYAPQQGYTPQQGGPWGGGGGMMGGGGGGGFLTGALSTAAGVAGGVLMADSIRGLFSGGHAAASSLGIAQGVPGVGGGDTITNNYYGGDSGALRDADKTQDDLQDQADNQQSDWQQDADQDQDSAQDAGWSDDDFG